MTATPRKIEMTQPRSARWLLTAAFATLILLVAFSGVAAVAATDRPDLIALVLGAAGLAVIVAVRTIRAVVQPLADLSDTLSKQVVADQNARAAIVGPAEIRALASALNTVADDRSELRAADVERARLRERARAVGLRIRERLAVDVVIAETVLALGPALEADQLFVRLVTGAEVGPAYDWRAGIGIADRRKERRGAGDEGSRDVWTDEQRAAARDAARGPADQPPADVQPVDVQPAGVQAADVRSAAPRPEAADLGQPPGGGGGDRRLPPGPAAWLADLYFRNRSWSARDIRVAAPGLPDADLTALLAQGAVSVLVTPFGVGNELLGGLVLVRSEDGRPWREVEVEAVETVANDLARGLQQARLYEQQQAVVAELRALNQARTDFLSTVSHELRTPLTSIAGYVEMLRDEDTGPIDERQDRMLDIVERNVARLRGLIEDLLALSRIELNAFKTVRHPVELRELAAAAVAAVEPVALAGGLTLTVDYPHEPLVVSGDSNQLDRVLLNLLSNAVKFTPPGGEVEIALHPPGANLPSVTGTGTGTGTVRGTDAREGAGEDMATLVVTDTGIGIPEDEQKAMFTRWFRASNATALSVPGTGIGLTIVRAVVANHGGELTVESGEGRGTRVVVRLPVYDASRAGSAADEEIDRAI